MPMKIDGQWHDTISDAAEVFKVAPKTVQDWIKNGYVPKPAVLKQGRREIQVFNEEYYQRAKTMLAESAQQERGSETHSSGMNRN